MIKFRLALTTALCIICLNVNASEWRIVNLKCNHASNPLGIDSQAPQFSWEVLSDQRSFRQQAYQILVADSPDKLSIQNANVWNSGKIKSNQSTAILYKGDSLLSRKKYFWKVVVWADDLNKPVESKPANFEMGLLHQTDWNGDWVGFPFGWVGRVLYFRHVFSFKKPIEKARVYIAGIGYSELEINGRKVGEDVLNPATSNYAKSVYYSTYNIDDYLKSNNVLIATVAPGWYGMPKLRMQLEIAFKDGTSEVIHSSSLRTVTTGPVVTAGILDGEYYDAQKENAAWLIPSDTIIKSLPDKTWGYAPIVEPPGGYMVSQQIEPIRVVASFAPKSIVEVEPDKFVIDAGQNMAGWVVLKVKGDRGTKITLRFAETLYKNGTVNQENLRTASATDVYILKGGGEEVWHPRFTYHGFRYVQIEGWPGKPELNNFEFNKVRSSVEAAGTFTSSNKLLNAINEMVCRTEASNLHSIPTDCPQRDERMGWLNDLTVRIEQAVYNFNLHRFYEKYIRDVAETQAENGAITDTAPFRYGGQPADPVSVSFLLLALKSYEFYGNTEIIRHHYSQMKAWIDYLNTRTENGIVNYSYYGDWSPPAGESKAGTAYGALSINTPGELISTGYLFYGASIIARFAEILGIDADKEFYKKLATTTLKAFNEKFWNEETGGYGSNNQACNSFALYIGAPSNAQKLRTIKNLVEDVKKHNYHLTTGNLCTKYLLEVLTENNYEEVAFKIATQTSYPSWGYMLENGATTLWERWEYLTGGSMNSHNHPMMGSVGSWLYKYVLGIVPDAKFPGFEKFVLHPYVFNDLNAAAGSYLSVKGLIKSSWKKRNGAIEYAITVPPNSIATVFIPSKNHSSVREGERPISKVRDCKFLRAESNCVVYEVGSGNYTFVSKW